MEQLRDEETVRRLRNRLETQLDTAAKSVVRSLCVFADLLIEITRPGQDLKQKPEAADTESEMLTTKQAAEYLGLKPSTLTTWRCTGRYLIPFVKVGRKTRYRKADLDKFVEQRTIAHTGEAASW
jgi:excisionase family DNA binding protein